MLLGLRVGGSSLALPAAAVVVIFGDSQRGDALMQSLFDTVTEAAKGIQSWPHVKINA